MELPKEPMAPITIDTLPSGAEWGYQIKWDGVRILAVVDHGKVQLYSRNMLSKNETYPEIVRMLSALKGRFVLDGEAVVFDMEKQRPVFQKVLQRERSKAGIPALVQKEPVCYVLFDLLFDGDEDLRALPYTERHKRLLKLFPTKEQQLFVTDLFPYGHALWQWVETNGWEGVVAKRLSSPYGVGKKHSDWYKKKTAVVLDVDIIGLTIRSGAVASMVMLYEGQFLGKVSLGLNMESKSWLLTEGRKRELAQGPFRTLPAELKGEQVLWLKKPFACKVTGLEITSAGLLRHPKIVHLTWGDK